MFVGIHMRLRYHRVRIKDEYINKTIFWTWYGHYDFLVVPLGYLMHWFFHVPYEWNFLNYLDKFFILFFDDIKVYSNYEEEHEKYLGNDLVIIWNTLTIWKVE